MTTIRFWGVRGSVPTPPSTQELRQKMRTLLRAYQQDGCPENIDKYFENYIQLGVPEAGFYGGNTSCVEVIMDGQRFVLDMGTGMRPLGGSLMKEMFARGGLSIIFLLSHLHWDHLQGLPFFGPIHANKALGIQNLFLDYFFP